MKYFNIPPEMTAKKNWVLWGGRREHGINEVDAEGKLNKVPCQKVRQGGRYKGAKANDERTWDTFNNAKNAMESGFFNGIGFQLSDNFCGIDLDHVSLNERHIEVINKFKAFSYIEYSPSGDGLHIICYGHPIATGKNKGVSKWLECYGTNSQGRSSPRYLTVTGERYENTTLIESTKESTSALLWLYDNFFKSGDISKRKKTKKNADIADSHARQETFKNRPDKNNISFDISRFVTDGLLDADKHDRNNSLYKSVSGVLQHISEKIEASVTSFFLAKTTLPHDEAERTIHSALFGYQRDTRDTTTALKPMSFFFDSSSGTPKIISQGAARNLLMSSCSTIRDFKYDTVTGEWLRRQNNIWSVIESINPYIDAIITSVSDPKVSFSADWLAGICTLLKNTLGANVIPHARNYIPFSNGVLNLTRQCLSTYESIDGDFTWQIPHDFSKNTQKPIFSKFMRELNPNVEVRQLLRAYMYAILTGLVEIEKFLVLVGHGGSGKGTFIRLCTKLVGIANTATTSFSRLEGDSARFELGTFYQKRLVVIPDAEFFLRDASVLKSMTGEDPLPYERKGSNKRFLFKLSGMLLIASNEPLQIGKNDHAVLRRMITVSCKFTPAKIDMYLDAKLDREIPAIVNWALGLGKNDVVEILQNASLIGNTSRNNLTSTSPLAAWVDEYIQYKVGERCYIGRLKVLRVSKAEGGDSDGDRVNISQDEIQNTERLYPSYYKFCKMQNLSPLSAQKFTRAFESFMTGTLKCDVKKTRDKKGYYFTNVIINARQDGVSLLSNLYENVAAIADDKYTNDGLE